MLGSFGLPLFPIDVESGRGVDVSRHGTSFRFDLDDSAILTGGSGSLFTVSTEPGDAKLKRGLGFLIQANRDFAGAPRIEVDDAVAKPWLDIEGQPLARVIKGRLYRVVYDPILDAFRSDSPVLVANDDLEPVPFNTLKGSDGGGLEDLSVARARALLDVDHVTNKSEDELVASGPIADAIDAKTTFAEVDVALTPIRSSLNEKAARSYVDIQLAARDRDIDELATDVTNVQTQVDAIASGQSSGTIVAKTWPALAAVTPTANARAEVLDEDTGTHSDPVTSAANTPNAGTFRGSVSPLGWERVGVTTKAAILAAVATGLGSLTNSFVPDADVVDDEGKSVIALPVTDKDGRSSLYGTEDGSVVIVRKSHELVELDDPEVLEADTDKAWRPWTIRYRDGSVAFPGGIRGYAGGGTGTGIAAAARAPQVAPSIKYRLLYGQSLATGTAGLPLLSTTALYGTLMFAGGIRLLDNSDMTSFVDAVETKDSALGETGAVASAHHSSTYLAALLGLTPTTLGSNYFVASGGRGGAELTKLAKGSGFYNNMQAIPNNATPIATALGRTFGLSVIEMIHGQADIAFGRTRAAYASGLVQLRRDIEADTKAITGQTGVIPMLVSQAACQAAYYKRLSSTAPFDRAYPDALPTPEIDMAMMDAAAVDPYTIVHMSLYCTGDLDGGDGVHRGSEDYRMIGRNRGRAAAKIEKALAEGTPIPEVAVRPLSYIVQKRTARIKYSVPFGPLVFDESWVLPTFNKGFDVWDVSGATPVLADIIQSVTIVGKDTVEIKFKANLPLIWRLTYAWGRNESADGGRSKGPRGNLRDCEGDSPIGSNNTYVDDSGVTRRLDNYALLHAFTNKV